ncbi:hypothetical protein CJ030_MR2G011250 [Morella rubra]|uniref:Uncharacterized protein n=1 Tax=Morella rubra TaxID=262757 RepID=A0A6A1WE43_9ROSI|nr:hypothetical protein CJ030_MR2G011250 [Morella rubra]
MISVDCWKDNCCSAFFRQKVEPLFPQQMFYIRLAMKIRKLVCIGESCSLNYLSNSYRLMTISNVFINGSSKEARLLLGHHCYVSSQGL